MQAAACAIDIHSAGAAWSKALIDNAARPSGALVFTGPDPMGEAQFARLKEELERAHTGPANAGRPLLLEGGLEWRPMSLTPAELDFVAARHAAARDIALAFGVPPLLLGLPGDNTYANYREANLAFWRQTVLPLAQKLAAALNRWLGNGFADAGPAKVLVDLESLPALGAERDALWSRLEASSFLSLAEKRALAGLPPTEETP
jgi:HK97 family phage portal protein